MAFIKLQILCTWVNYLSFRLMILTTISSAVRHCPKTYFDRHGGVEYPADATSAIGQLASEVGKVGRVSSRSPNKGSRITHDMPDFNANLVLTRARCRVCSDCSSVTQLDRDCRFMQPPVPGRTVRPSLPPYVFSAASMFFPMIRMYRHGSCG